MEWKTTWEDPLTSYLKCFAGVIGDQRTHKTFGETVKGLITAGSLICQQIAAASAELSRGRLRYDQAKAEQQPSHHRTTLGRAPCQERAVCLADDIGHQHGQRTATNHPSTLRR